jgi:capsular polysaccharide transport system ATP-binding protein
MIDIDSVSKYYETRFGPRRVLNGVSLKVDRRDKVGILGRNGAGKSTLIRLISGAELPSSGAITRSMSVSWPLAFTGAFQAALTGIDNLKFICRIYGKNWRDHLDYVRDFTELGVYLREPIRSYSSGMQMRLAFAISMVIEFDCFLIDEIIAVGDARFHAKCLHELFEKRADRALIIVSHDASYIRDHCEHAAVLHQGLLTNFDDIDHAFSYYAELLSTNMA